MRARPYICALLLGTGAGLMAGCGDRSSLIPSGDAQELKAQIAAVKQAAESRECGASTKALQQARATITNLPDGVDARLRQRLRTGVSRLETQADQECREAETTPPEEPTTTESVPQSVPETTTTTVPTTTTTTPAPTTPVEPTDPGVDPGGAAPTEPGTPEVPADPGGAAPFDPSQEGDGR